MELCTVELCTVHCRLGGAGLQAGIEKPLATSQLLPPAVWTWTPVCGGFAAAVARGHLGQLLETAVVELYFQDALQVFLPLFSLPIFVYNFGESFACI